MVICPGAWANFEEIEEKLSLAELQAILSAGRKREFERNKFAAALQGVKIDEPEDDLPTGDDIRRRAEAKIRGMSDEQYEFAEMGIEIQEEE